MKRSRIAIPIFLTIASAADAATLTITPDKQVYQVGEQITLNVFGDSQGAVDNFIYGRIEFNAELATYVASSQVGLTSFGGQVPWFVASLIGGVGFGEAFFQTPPTVDGQRVDGPLSASIVLDATGPGTLVYSWHTGGPSDDLTLDFFGLTTAPGGAVVIVPEPVTGILLWLGLFWLTTRRRGIQRGWAARHATPRTAGFTRGA